MTSEVRPQRRRVARTGTGTGRRRFSLLFLLLLLLLVGALCSVIRRFISARSSSCASASTSALTSVPWRPRNSVLSQLCLNSLSAPGPSLAVIAVSCVVFCFLVAPLVAASLYHFSTSSASFGSANLSDAMRVVGLATSNDLIKPVKCRGGARAALDNGNGALSAGLPRVPFALPWRSAVCDCALCGCGCGFRVQYVLLSLHVFP